MTVRNTVRRIAVTGAACLALVVPTLVISAPAATAIGIDRCPHNFTTQTNDWHAFWSRKIRAYERVCIRIGNGTRYHRVNYPMMSFVRRPTITTPSAWPIPSGEKVRITKDPWVYRTQRRYGDLIRVWWRFSAKSCTLVCTSWDFSFLVSTNGTQLCIVRGDHYGSCDRFDWW